MAERTSKLFVLTALIHAVIAAIISSFFIFPPSGDSALGLTRMIAGGSAGTWVAVGYTMYIIAGFVGLSVWSYIYATYGETNEWLSLAHLLLHNVGLLAPLFIFTAGIQGGTLALQGNPGAIHNAIVWSSEPSGILLGLVILGTIIGVVNVLLALLTKK